VHAAFEAHARDCADCRATATEAALDGAIDRLPPLVAPEPLKRRLEALVAHAGEVSVEARAAEPAAPVVRAAVRRLPARPRWLAPLASACAAALVTLVVLRAAPDGAHRAGAGSAASSSDLVSEAVNDHIRVVSSSHPVEIESGGIHQVKPWFTGRLDFAPRVAFAGDDDFPLVGGSVGYFHDRKVAVFSFKRRLHAITLLVFPSAGIDWPPRAAQTKIGRLDVGEQSQRGFTTLAWRDGDLAYALVSDVNREDLEALAARVNP
jgi:anti-sigma factor RsiW